MKDDFEEEMRLMRKASRDARLATYLAAGFAAAGILLWLVTSVVHACR